VLLHRGLDLAAIVISESEGSTVPLDSTLATLRHFADVPLLAIPRTRETAGVEEAFARLGALISSHLDACSA